MRCVQGYEQSCLDQTAHVYLLPCFTIQRLMILTSFVGRALWYFPVLFAHVRNLVFLRDIRGHTQISSFVILTCTFCSSNALHTKLRNSFKNSSIFFPCNSERKPVSHGKYVIPKSQMKSNECILD